MDTSALLRFGWIGERRKGELLDLGAPRPACPASLSSAAAQRRSFNVNVLFSLFILRSRSTPEVYQGSSRVLSVSLAPFPRVLVQDGPPLFSPPADPLFLYRIRSYSFNPQCSTHALTTTPLLDALYDSLLPPLKRLQMLSLTSIASLLLLSSASFAHVSNTERNLAVKTHQELLRRGHAAIASDEQWERSLASHVQPAVANKAKRARVFGKRDGEFLLPFFLEEENCPCGTSSRNLRSELTPSSLQPFSSPML